MTSDGEQYTCELLAMFNVSTEDTELGLLVRLDAHCQ